MPRQWRDTTKDENRAGPGLTWNSIFVLTILNPKFEARNPNRYSDFEFDPSASIIFRTLLKYIPFSHLYQGFPDLINSYGLHASWRLLADFFKTGTAGKIFFDHPADPPPGTGPLEIG
jgi:hypothetical protein